MDAMVVVMNIPSHSVGRVAVKLQRNPSESCGGGRRQGGLSPFIISTVQRLGGRGGLKVSFKDIPHHVQNHNIDPRKLHIGSIDNWATL